LGVWPLCEAFFVFAIGLKNALASVVLFFIPRAHAFEPINPGQNDRHCGEELRWNFFVDVDSAQQG